jgi:hypothetical protein
VLHNTKLERLASGKHSNLLGPFVSCKENGVLRAQCQDIELLTFQIRKDQIKNVELEFEICERNETQLWQAPVLPAKKLYYCASITIRRQLRS